jgi:hypothetical protein
VVSSIEVDRTQKQPRDPGFDPGFDPEDHNCGEYT